MKNKATKKIQAAFLTLSMLLGMLTAGPLGATKVMADIGSAPPAEGNIEITNYISGLDDKVVVKGLISGDTVKVYDAEARENLMGQSVAVGTTATVTVKQVQTTQTMANNDTVYVTVTSSGQPESAATAKTFTEEPIPWQIYDHTGNWGEDYKFSNFATGKTDTRKTSANNGINTGTPPAYPYGDDDPLGVAFNKHIIVKDNGSRITFYGYGGPSYKDFIFLSSNSTQTKTITFDMDFSKVSFHTLDGAGILFNTNITADGKLSGYALMFTGDANDSTGEETKSARKIILYEISKVDVTNFHNMDISSGAKGAMYSVSGSNISGTITGITPYTLVNYGDGTELGEDLHHIQLEVSPGHIKMTDNNVINDAYTDSSLPVTAGTTYGNGVGFIASYLNHDCSVLSYLSFTNVKIGDPTISYYPWPILDLSAKSGDGQATLSYTTPSNAKVAAIQVSTDANFSNPDNIITVPVDKDSSAATVTNLTNGTPYYFKLLVGDGENAGSSNVATATPTLAPTVASALAKVDNTHVMLSFSKPVTAGSSASGCEKISNYTLSGTGGLTGNPTGAVRQANGTDVLLTVPNLSGLTAGKTVTVVVKNVTDSASGTVVNPNYNTANYVQPSASITAAPGTLTEAEANDGSLSSGVITVTAANGSFAEDIAKSDVTVNGLPDGMDYTVAYVDGTHITVTLTGKAASHRSADSTHITIQVAKGKLTGASENTVTGNIAINFIDVDASITADPVTLTEAEANDGSLSSGVITVTAVNGSFAEDIAKGDVTVNGLPDGMDYTVAYNSEKQITVMLTGKAVNNKSTDSTHVTIQVAKDKLSGASEDAVTGNIAINFIDADASITADPVTLTEAAANDGSLSSGEITVTAANGSFAEDIAKGDVTVNGLPDGMDYTVTYDKSEKNITVTLTGKAVNNKSTDSTHVTIQVSKDKLTGASEDAVTGNIAINFIDADASITADPVTLTEAAANDGSLSSGKITVTAVNGSFVENVAKSDVTVNGLPTGMDYTVAYNSEKQITVMLTGKAASHRSADSTNITIQVAKDKLTGASEDAVTGNIAINFIDADASITADPVTLTEAAANDGSLSSGKITVTAVNGSFAENVAKSDVTVNGLPTGMDYTVAYNSEKQITVMLTGKAASHRSSDSTHITIQVAKDKLSGASEDAITGNIAINFIDADASITADPITLTEAAANDGSLSSGKITVTAVNGNFLEDIAKGDVTVNGLPDGMDYTVTYDKSEKNITVMLTGKAVNNKSTDSTHVTIQVSKDKLTGTSEDAVTGNIAINFIDADASITADPVTLTEAAANDGSLSSGAITVTAVNGSFAEDIAKSDVTVNGLPDGMDYTVTYDEIEKNIIVTLTGKAASHRSSDSTHITIQVAKDKLSGASEDAITGNIAINFIDPVRESSGGADVRPSAPADGPKIVANVIDTVNNKPVETVSASVAVNADGTDVVKVKPSDAIMLKQPDGTKSPLEDYSKVSYIAPANIPVKISSDGTVEVNNLVKGNNYDIPVTYDMGNGQKITIGTMHIAVDNGGNVNMTSDLIDPYGTLTDSLSGNIINGASVTLYYADTAKNSANGIKANTIVKLPAINGFKPNNNQNPQTSDNTGAYGFMVYPDTDYYIVVAKDGYDTFTSRTISVKDKLVKFSARINPPVIGVKRIAGNTRVDTAIEIAKAEFSGKVNSIIFATAGNYPDALTGSVLAYQQSAPILLVGDSQDDQDKVLTYMKNYLVAGGKVFLLGGTGVVTENFAAQVKAAGYSNIIRLGGLDRYETSAKIAEYLNVEEGSPVVIASGENYPDALSVSSAAAVNQYPILLVTKNTVSDLVKSQLEKIKPGKIYVIGEQGAISNSVKNEIGQLVSLGDDNNIRLGGLDRYSTSVIVANNFKLSGKSACIATGTNFPDALAGSIYAANYNAPIILVGSTITDEEKSYLENSKSTGFTILGGEGAVNAEIQTQVEGFLSK